MEVVGSDCRVQETTTTLRMSARGPPKYFSLSTAIPRRVKGAARRKKESVTGNGSAAVQNLLNGQRHQSFNGGRRGVKKQRPRRQHLQRPDPRKGGKRNSRWSLSFFSFSWPPPISLGCLQFPHGSLCTWFGCIYYPIRYSVTGRGITCTLSISSGHSPGSCLSREQIVMKTSPLSFE